MMMARMRPLDPSSAPAVISSLLSSTNPIATAERPGVGIQDRDHGRHVGAADRDDQQDAEEQRQHDDRPGTDTGAHGAVGLQRPARGQRNGDAEQQQVDDVLQRIGDRPLRNPLHFLQLPGRHQAAGEREVAEDDLGDERRPSGTASGARALRQPAGSTRPCRPGPRPGRRTRATARSAAARRSAAPATAARRRRSRPAIARTIQQWWITPRLRPRSRGRRAPSPRRRRTRPCAPSPACSSSAARR